MEDWQLHDLHIMDAAVDVHSDTLATVQHETMGDISHGNKNQAMMRRVANLKVWQRRTIKIGIQMHFPTPSYARTCFLAYHTKRAVPALHFNRYISEAKG